MTRQLKIFIGILAIMVIGGLIYLRILNRRVARLAQMQATEEQAGREVVAPQITTPTDKPVKAQIFWAAADRSGSLAPVEIEMPLSADRAERGKQVLHALIAAPPTPAQRTLPADLVLFDFYILPDGTAIADFSDALTTETPSGILSEAQAVNSIARTLEKNIAGLHRLKILIHGQEVDSVAGHADLTGFFDLVSPVLVSPTQGAPPANAAAPPTAAPPTTAKPPR
ncbi:MAG: GerMN domain-containing protein [Candidatus Acidiferrales bacterium]